MTIDELLKISVEKRASDLHLTVGVPPQLRIDGTLLPIQGAEPLDDQQCRALAYQMLNPEQISKFEQTKELDTAYSIKGLCRFRVNLFFQRSSIAAAIRMIPFEVPTMSGLGLPPVLEDYANRPHGLIIISGPTGCGKSTTLAAMIEKINSTRNCHVISVEDPIEYLHRHKKATINQRELGVDTNSFPEALKHIVREDPDVIMIGEMRDLETMSAALTLAETGHLVLTTLHTSDCVHAIQRIVDIFPPYHQDQIRLQLSLVLIGIVVQRLVPKATGQGRVVACEVMTATASVSNLIRENQLQQLRSAIQTGRRSGMCTMNHSYAELFQKGLVTWEEITRRSADPEELSNLVKSAVKL